MGAYLILASFTFHERMRRARYGNSWPRTLWMKRLCSRGKKKAVFIERAYDGKQAGFDYILPGG